MNNTNIEKINKLKIFKLKIFEWVNVDVAKDIIFWCEVRKYKSWDVIVKEWEESNWEWYILIGWNISVNIWNKEIAKLNEWEIFWEIALLSEDERTATVIALNDIEVIVLTMDNLIGMIENENNSINEWIMDRIEANINNQ